LTLLNTIFSKNRKNNLTGLTKIGIYDNI